MLEKLRGEIYLILGATLFAFNGVVAKVVLAEGLSPWRLTQARSGGAFLILIIFFLLFKRHELRATRQEIPWLIAFGVVAVVLVQALYFVAIGRIYLGTALLIEFTAPIWILLFMRFILKKQVDRLLWLALALAFSGLMVVTQVWKGLTLDGIGLLAAFLDWCRHDGLGFRDRNSHHGIHDAALVVPDRVLHHFDAIAGIPRSILTPRMDAHCMGGRLWHPLALSLRHRRSSNSLCVDCKHHRNPRTSPCKSLRLVVLE